MRTHLMGIAFLAMLVATTGMSQAFAQVEEPISISTDKESYDEGDTVVVNGVVRDLLSGYDVSLQVFEPEFGNRIFFDQPTVSADKTFTVEITPGGQLWKYPGTYTVKVLYGVSREAETTFEFSGSDIMVKPPKGTMIDGWDDPINLQITGGTVESIEPDVDHKSLIINIDSTDDGQLTIELPRGVIDAVLPDGADDDFIVLVDGEEVDFEETKDSDNRTLTIDFLAGAEEIEIIGTTVIPEFGTIAVIILAVAIVSIIAVSSRTKLNVLPKY